MIYATKRVERAHRQRGAVGLGSGWPTGSILRLDGSRCWDATSTSSATRAKPGSTGSIPTTSRWSLTRSTGHLAAGTGEFDIRHRICTRTAPTGGCRAAVSFDGAPMAAWSASPAAMPTSRRRRSPTRRAACRTACCSWSTSRAPSVVQPATKGFTSLCCSSISVAESVAARPRPRSSPIRC